MKRILALLITAALLFSLAACGGSGKNGGPDADVSDTASASAQNNEENTLADEVTAFPAEDSEYYKNGALVFRAFTELPGEEFVSLVEAQGYAWYNDDYVMSGFADEGKSSGFQKNFLAEYIQVYNSPSDYRSYEDIRSAGKGDLAKTAVAFNVKGAYADGQAAVADVFDGLEILDTHKDAYDEKGSGAARIKDGNGTEYLVMYTSEFYTDNTAAVSFIVRTDAYFAATPFGGTANSIDAAWSRICS